MLANTPQVCTTNFTTALIRRDMSSALAFLMDDVVFFYSNGTVIVGKEAFSSVMAANWKMVSDYQYSNPASTWIAQSETAATVIYSFAWSGVARDQKVSGGGRGTRVLCKGRSGWLIAHEHLSNGQWLP
jgi:ketosteroid isomerase-like protein